MKAWTRTRYGGPEIMIWEEAAIPAPEGDQILVSVKANSANPVDWHILRGDPFFSRFTFGVFRPKDKIVGADFAGVVEKVGPEVQHFSPGDHVFGETLMGGAFAELVNVSENFCAQMPASSSFEDMACMPVAGLTALQALMTHGQLKPGETVLINGASGGVGHFAVQIAKAHGANVTGVCSSRNRDFVTSLGADHVIPYDQEDIHRHKGRYSLVLDTNGNLNLSDFRRMGERGVLTGFTTMGHMMSVLLKNVFVKYPLAQFTASANRKDLETLAGLVEAGKIRPRIEKSYPSQKIPEAISYIEAMRTRGKVSIVWPQDV